MIRNWIKIFIYQLRQNMLFSILNILGLSIGIGGIIFAILYWNNEQSYNAWNPEKEKVFQVICDVGEDMHWAYNVAPVGPILKQKAPEVESQYYYFNNYYNEIIRYKGKKEMIDKVVDGQNTFFALFPFEFVKGNAKTALLDKTSIAISEETAQKVFGDEDPLNKTIQYLDKSLVVRGVYRVSGKSSIAPMAVTNLIDSTLKENIDQWGNFNFGLLLKLKNPADADKVAKKIEQIFYENRTVRDAKETGMSPEDFVKKYGTTKVFLEPLKTARLHASADGYPEGKGNYQFLVIMAGLSVLILLLSIVNYVNLATANAIKRAKEVGVRKIIGASKGNIIRQFLFETTLLTVFAILLALTIVELTLPYYNEFLSKELVMTGSEFYLQLMSIFVIVIVVAGIFPAVYVSNFESLKVLKGNFGRSKSGVWLRNGMLILQFAIASFFIVGSYIVYSQVDYMNHKDLGFKGQQVIDVRFRFHQGESKFDRYPTIKQELLKIPGVKGVSAGNFTFGYGANSSSGFNYKGGQNIQAKNMAMDYNMLELMNVKILQGRGFSAEMASDTTTSILVNERTVAMMGEKEPLGKEIEWNSKKLKIVGVVQNFHVMGPQEEIPPMTFFHYKTIDWMQGNMNRIFVKVDPKNMDQTIAAIEKFWGAKVDTEYPFSYDFVDKNFARTYEQFVKQKNLFSLLNIVVILIALFGLFALASYSIERRMKEIAIRKTLGAETSSLLKELSKQYLVFCIIGFLVAFVPTWIVLQKWLEDFAYRIPISAIPFIIGFVVLCSLTILIVLTKAYQATRIDVLKYLKYE
jgi:putative ABC transport system permease protein